MKKIKGTKKSKKNKKTKHKNNKSIICNNSRLNKFEGRKAPIITLNVRKRDNNVKGENKYSWDKLNTKDIYKNKRIIIFAIPGAYNQHVQIRIYPVMKI